MNNDSFGKQIAAAIQELGAEAAAGCMARALICLAHSASNDFEFKCDQGTVSIERTFILESEKH